MIEDINRVDVSTIIIEAPYESPEWPPSLFDNNLGIIIDIKKPRKFIIKKYILREGNRFTWNTIIIHKIRQIIEGIDSFKFPFQFDLWNSEFPLFGIYK